MKIRFLVLSMFVAGGLASVPASAQFGGFLDGAANAVKSKVENARGAVKDAVDGDRAADAALADMNARVRAALPTVDQHEYETALSVSDQMCEEIIDPFRLSGNVTEIAEQIVLKDGVNALRQLTPGGAIAASGEDLLATAKTRAKQLNWLPMDQEIAYGQKIHDAVLANEKRAIVRTNKGRVERLYEDADELLARVMEQITEEHPYNFQLLLIDNNDINATALPGGFLHINTGVLENAGAELVLAHEIGHVFKRHQTRETQARLIDTVDSVEDLTQLLSNNPDAVDQSMDRAASLYGAIQNYSRQQELQADACAVRMAARVPGIDLDARIDTYVESISQTTETAQPDPDQDSAVDDVLASLPLPKRAGHPDYPERQQRMKEVARQLVPARN